MPARIEQPAIIMLSMDLDQMLPEFAQQARGRRLIVDERPAAPVRLDDPPDDQR